VTITDKELEREMRDAELMAKSGMKNVLARGAGSSNQYGSFLGGRLSGRKQIDDDLDVEAYLEGQAFKPKEGKTNRELTGGGIKVTKRFKKGGAVSASKRADGCAVRGKTKGKII
jgi:hypothetical protein